MRDITVRHFTRSCRREGFRPLDGAGSFDVHGKRIDVSVIRKRRDRLAFLHQVAAYHRKRRTHKEKWVADLAPSPQIGEMRC